MQRILVTGGTGTLGKQLVPQLMAAGHQVRAMSRSSRANEQNLEWVQADLMSGAGLEAAVANIDTIIHAASSPSAKTVETDIHGTKRLLEHAEAAGVKHIIYVSIVGVDRIPFAYYRHKLAAESLIAQSEVPWSIQRITQFHDFMASQIAFMNRLPLLLWPSDFQVQPIHTADAAKQLVSLVESGPTRAIRSIGGPEVLSYGDIAKSWLAAKGKARRVVFLPLPGGLANAFRQGYATCPEKRIAGGTSWETWLHG